MKRIKEDLERQIKNPNYIGSGSTNTEGFDEFFEQFKKSFTNQLRKISAKEIEFNKGHFDITGFFKIQDQYYYFSTSDVRDGCRKGLSLSEEPRMLIRTAEHKKDYTGGRNIFIPIEPKMYKEIFVRLKLPEDVLKEPSKKGKTDEELVNEIIEKGGIDKYVGSMKKANHVIFKLQKELGCKYSSISVRKRGNMVVQASYEDEKLKFFYDGDTKRMTVTIGEITDEKFLNRLHLKKEGETVKNPFSGESCYLEPLAVALHDFIKGCEMTNNRVEDMQRAMRIFSERWPEEYMILLD